MVLHYGTSSIGNAAINVARDLGELLHGHAGLKGSFARCPRLHPRSYLGSEFLPFA